MSMLRAALLVSTLLMACDEAAPSAAVDRAHGGAGSGLTTAHSGTENSPVGGEYEEGDAGQGRPDAGASSLGGASGAADNVMAKGGSGALGGAVASSDGAGSAGKGSADGEGGHAG